MRVCCEQQHVGLYRSMMSPAARYCRHHSGKMWSKRTCCFNHDHQQRNSMRKTRRGGRRRSVCRSSIGENNNNNRDSNNNRPTMQPPNTFSETSNTNDSSRNNNVVKTDETAVSQLMDTIHKRWKLEELFEKSDTMMSNLNNKNEQKRRSNNRKGNENDALLKLNLSQQYSSSKLQEYYQSKPIIVLKRITQFAITAARIAFFYHYYENTSNASDTYKGGADNDSNSTGSVNKFGSLLRSELSHLGPVVVKCAQTLSQREDMIGKENAVSFLIIFIMMASFVLI